MVIVVSGMIGIGKTSVAQILGDGLDSKVYYEHVSDNPILPLFYQADQKEINEKSRWEFSGRPCRKLEPSGAQSRGAPKT